VLVVGLLAAPGPASELTESLAGEIAGRLGGQLPGVRWRAEFVSDRLVQPPTDLSELIAAGRRMVLERGWQLAVCVTDLPLQTARRPVIAHVSATHGVAVLSMPALGPVSVRKRTAETIVRLVGHMLGGREQAAGAAGRLPLAEAVTRRMRELGARTERGEQGVGFVARVVTGNIWLLLGMLRANRPWRLALRLMRALAVAFAAGVFALVTSDIWRLAHYLGPLRSSGTGPGWPTRSAWPGWPPRSRRWAAPSARYSKPARPCARRPTPINRIPSFTPSPTRRNSPRAQRSGGSAVRGQPWLLPAG